MLDRILLAVDGSDGAATALAAAAVLAADAASEVVVVHVSDHGRLLRSVYGPDSLTLEWETPPEARALVDAAVARLTDGGVRARGRVYGQFDTIAKEVLEAARAEGCGLVAMGTRGRGRVAGSLLGSVAHRVIHLADSPVLVTPPTASPPDTRLRRILLPVDGSPPSNRALELAAEVAVRTGGEVVVLHVCEPHGGAWQRYVPAGVVVEQDMPESADALVDAAVQALEARGVTSMATVTPGAGDVAESILQTAHVHSTELIVIGSRGRGAVPALVLGSTAYRLLHRAHLPVLVGR